MDGVHYFCNELFEEVSNILRAEADIEDDELRLWELYYFISHFTLNYLKKCKTENYLDAAKVMTRVARERFIYTMDPLFYQFYLQSSCYDELPIGQFWAKREDFYDSIITSDFRLNLTTKDLYKLDLILGYPYDADDKTDKDFLMWQDERMITAKHVFDNISSYLEFTVKNGFVIPYNEVGQIAKGKNNLS